MDALTWARQVVDAANGTGAYASLAIDPRDGIPFVSYHDATQGELRLASPVSAGNGNCGPGNSWWCRTVVSDGDVGRFSSLATWYDGAAVWKLGIAYYNATTQSLDYAEYTEWGQDWEWTHTLATTTATTEGYIPTATS